MKIFFLLIFISGCSNLFYQPSPRLFVDPKQLKLEYQEYVFESSEKIKLHSWFFPATLTPAKGTIILFHGNAQNLSTHFLNLAWIMEHGYNLFIFDYRGYGQSEGKASQPGVHQDALAALEKGRELNQKYGNGSYIVYGQSLGGAISLRALADYQQVEEVDLIVQDSAFSSYKKIAFNTLAKRWFLLPFSPLAYVTVSDAYAADKVFHKIHRPLLVIVGLKDHIIPYKHGEEIYEEVASKSKWIWRLPQGRHIDIFHGENESYRPKFLNFLKQFSRK